MKNLKNKVAVVTGAGSGIGRAVSELLAKKGCDLALVDVNEQGLQEASETVKNLGRRASVHVVDVSDKEQMALLPEDVIKEHHHVHLLINNAGVFAIAPFEEHSIEDIEWAVGINFFGVIYGCKFFLPYLQQEEEGHIVNVSSLNGFFAFPTQSIYGATKFAVRAFTETLWTEMYGTNIHVTVVHPGGVKTNIVSTSRGADDGIKEKWIDAYNFGVKYTPETAAKRIVRGIEKNKMRVLFCPETYLLEWTKRFFPVISQYGAAWANLIVKKNSKRLNRIMKKING